MCGFPTKWCVRNINSCAMSKIINTIHIGSQHLSCCVVEKSKDEQINVHAFDKVGLNGFDKGQITDAEAFASDLKALVDMVNHSNIPKTIKDVVVNISSCSLENKNVSFSMDLKGSISQKHINRIQKAAEDEIANDDYCILHSSLNEAYIDGEPQVPNKIKGLRASNLELTYNFIYCKQAFIDELRQVFKQCKLRFSKLPVPTALASGNLCLSDKDKKEGVIHLNLSSQFTDMIIFKGHKVLDYRSIPFGSDAITKDISKTFGIKYEIAESVKQKYGIPNMGSRNTSAVYKVPGSNEGEVLEVPQYLLEQVIKCRLDEIIEIVKFHLAKLEVSGMNKIVVTGGGSLLKNLQNYFIFQFESTKVELGSPITRITNLDQIEEYTSTPSCISVLGMCLSAKQFDTDLNPKQGGLFGIQFGASTSKSKKESKLFNPLSAIPNSFFAEEEQTM